MVYHVKIVRFPQIRFDRKKVASVETGAAAELTAAIADSCTHEVVRYRAVCLASVAEHLHKGVLLCIASALGIALVTQNLIFFLVSIEDIVTLDTSTVLRELDRQCRLLAPITDVRQNDRVHVALGAPAVGGWRGVARVIAARVALVAIVGPENGGSHVSAVGTEGPVLAAGIAGRAEFGCHVGAVSLVAEEGVLGHGSVRRDADEERCRKGGRRRHVACSRESSR